MTEGGLDVGRNTTYERLWEMLREAMQEAVNKTSLSAVGREIGVEASTIKRWLDGDRGAKVSLRKSLAIIEQLGVPIVQVVSELAPDLAEILLSLDQDRQKHVKKLLEIAKEDGPFWEKLKKDLDFYYDVTSR